jgi:hypothetical protein
MKEFGDDPALDAGLVSAAQKVEHYEITSYGSLKAWAEQLGLDHAASLIEETMEEEKAADEKLSGIGEEVVNVEADTDEGEMAEAETDHRSSARGKNTCEQGWTPRCSVQRLQPQRRELGP